MSWNLYFKRDKSECNEYFSSKKDAEIRLKAMHEKSIEEFYENGCDKFFTEPHSYESFCGFYVIEPTLLHLNQTEESK